VFSVRDRREALTEPDSTELKVRESVAGLDCVFVPLRDSVASDEGLSLRVTLPVRVGVDVAVMDAVTENDCDFTIDRVDVVESELDRVAVRVGELLCD